MAAKKEVSAERLEEIAYDVAMLGDGTVMDGKNNLQTIVIHTLARLPDEVYDAVMYPSPLFIGPGPGQLGEALQLSLAGPPSGDKPQRIDRNVVVLSNELCDQPIEDAMWTVAHELAHIYLGHLKRGGASSGVVYPLEAETDADQLAVSWGFELPEWRRRQSNE